MLAQIHKKVFRIPLLISNVCVISEPWYCFIHITLFWFLGARLLDPQKQDHFTLVVTVKDLAGMTGNAFTNNADVEITVKENLWKAPPPVHIRENYLGPYPNNITQVGSRKQIND